MDIDVTTADDEIPATTPPPTSPQMQQEQKVPEQEELPQLMNANGDEDPYKPEGHIQFKIEKFSELAKLSDSDGRRLSEPVYIRGLPWRLLAIPRDGQQRRTPMGVSSHRGLGYFLQCNADNTDTSWSCTGSAILKVLPQKEGKVAHEKKVNHMFHSKENDWGFSHFMSFDELMDPESGWYNQEEDSIILAADAMADAPHGVNWDSKKDTGCIGLRNQGATCYMNSILQTLYFTNQLRKAVYQMPTAEDNPESSVALAMQRVFFELQFSDAPVCTRKLTKSFGWDSVDSFLQNDVQEFCRVLLDNLENKMKDTTVADTIPSLFKGRMKSYVKCKEVAFESAREECFYDIQLNVKNKTNVMESFKDYVQPEVLDGENKYDAGDFGLQPAEKGLKFLSFPPVLHLQLMRFQYDHQMDTNVKVNDRFEFPDTLELDEFVATEGKEHSEKEKGEFVYLLYAVLVHSGDFHGGHYVAFININLNGSYPKWCKFDDDVVSRVAHRDAVTANFGGDNPEGLGRQFTSAYMLVYIKKNAVEQVLSPVLASEIPEHLKVRFENEKKREHERQIEQEEANFYCETTLITDADMQPHHGFELFDHKLLEDPKRKMKMKKHITIGALYKFVATNMNLPLGHFRLWEMQSARREQHRFRVDALRARYLMDPEELSMTLKLHSDQVFYIESTLGDEDMMVTYDKHNQLLVFVKYFDAERCLTLYRGTLIIGMEDELSEYMNDFCDLVGRPDQTPLNLYLEASPEQVIQLQPKTKLGQNHQTKLDGIIIVVEEVDRMTDERNIPNYFHTLYNQIEVEAHLHEFTTNGRTAAELATAVTVNHPPPKTNGVVEANQNDADDNKKQQSNPAEHPIRGHMSLDWNLARVCSWIEDTAGYNLDNILLWKVAQPSEKPFIYLSSDQFRQFKLRDLLNLNNVNYYDPRNKRLYKMFYSLLPFAFFELENRRHLHLQMLHDDLQQTSEISVFPQKNATVREILEEARQQFRFTLNGSGKLRLVRVYSTSSCSRVFHVLKEEQTYNEITENFTSSAFVLRVEEVPRDQLEIGPNEHLFPVAHFDKDPGRMFGIPFFIKIGNGERISAIRQRVRQLLQVPEKEFEKYKLHIVLRNQIVRDLEEEDAESNIENLGEFLKEETQTLSAEPYLGIDHFNKNRGGRGGEKAIIIHN